MFNTVSQEDSLSQLFVKRRFPEPKEDPLRPKARKKDGSEDTGAPEVEPGSFAAHLQGQLIQENNALTLAERGGQTDANTERDQNAGQKKPGQKTAVPLSSPQSGDADAVLNGAQDMERMIPQMLWVHNAIKQGKTL